MGDVAVPGWGRVQVVASVLWLGVLLSGCAEHDAALLTSSLTDGEAASLPTSEAMLRDAKAKFSGGHYGSAVDAYARTVEKDAKNAEAWLGLAASYDQVSRFDAADKAYDKVQELVGATPSLLNNRGYSYVLRGNLDKARETLVIAYRGDPKNPYILNNIEILNRRLTALGHPPVVLY